MYMQNTHPVLTVLVAAVVLPPYQLQHLPTMQQNLELYIYPAWNALDMIKIARPVRNVIDPILSKGRSD